MQQDLEHNLQSALNGFVVDCREEIPKDDSELKIWIFARKDLTLSLGKFGAQSAHAAGTCMVLTDRGNSVDVNDYLALGQPKIVVGIDDEAELVKAVELCRAEMLVTVLVQDAGRTELGEKTLTMGAVGPCRRNDLPKPVKRLRTFKVPEPA
ncbi:peptidyl-tRNA hydrolase [Rhizobium sp. BK176]|uniref:peptidyl-tRNA hydrolase n=1 Tax=Rhizobium sp. BK176 TaxID=2587071 RepID=UPI002167EBFD|nr:peptidyl-tRNA hydrolase [Rhizobium sp. BK176]MCS4088606.1 peptidyl-tRNA hydrolase [Rhizobium sp. BK176]